MKYSLPVLPLLDFDAAGVSPLPALAVAASVGLGVPGVLADLEAAARESALAR